MCKVVAVVFVVSKLWEAWVNALCIGKWLMTALAMLLVTLLSAVVRCCGR